MRVAFSEPMVALGRIPEDVRPPFVRIAPRLPGRFRGSGTTTLLFTPDTAELPYGTRFVVTVDATATSAAGHRLARPHTFSCTTPPSA